MYTTEWKRTHNCGQLRSAQKGENVVLAGWVANHRDHGGLVFVDLRDRWGVTQVVFDPSEVKELAEMAQNLKMESVIGIKGKVIPRPADMVNKKIPTGEIEVAGTALTVFNECKPMPFPIKDSCDATDETRLKFRFLDLRRPQMQKNMMLRHQMAQAVRRYFSDKGFLEIETPFLMKSTPEGARDYIVPSRVHPGKFYALPQSPQTYKQLLMISGYDRYFQIVRCFRDEDLRADRQPEFTQIDLEMSFVTEDDVMEVMEGLMIRLFKEILNLDIAHPFPRLPYSDAMSRYGVDRPDLRYGLEIQDVSQIVADSDFRVFKETVASGNHVRGLKLEGAGHLSRKQIDQLTEYIKIFGAKGLVVMEQTEEGVNSSVSKFVSGDILNQVMEQFKAKAGDVVFLVADAEKICCESLGNLREKLAKEHQLIQKGTFAPLWVTDFPLLEWDKKEKRYVAMHHPFTSPKPEDVALLESEPGKVRARAYDLVLNGSEIAGGSIRIHQRKVQETMFRHLGLDREKAEKKFGFLMNALEFGAPPHGGIAFGYDRLVMIFAGEQSIREVIAFPKTTSALSLMDGSPSHVDQAQLKELGLKLNKPD